MKPNQISSVPLKPEDSCSFKTLELCDHLSKQSSLENEIDAKNNTKGLNNRETEALADSLLIFCLFLTVLCIAAISLPGGESLKLNYFCS